MSNNRAEAVPESFPMTGGDGTYSYTKNSSFQVMNVGSSIGKVGFLGDNYQKLWCLTNIETLSVWDWRESKLESNFQVARLLASNSWTLDHACQVDYFVDCHYSGQDDRLWVIGGMAGGMLGYFPVNYQGVRGIGCPETVFEGGHTDIVRSVLPMPGGITQGIGVFGWTGGEDGRLCCWLSDGCSGLKRSWVSSGLVIKSQKPRLQNRHRPY